jgi:hypothetical protein
MLADVCGRPCAFMTSNELFEVLELTERCWRRLLVQENQAFLRYCLQWTDLLDEPQVLDLNFRDLSCCQLKVKLESQFSKTS